MVVAVVIVFRSCSDQDNAGFSSAKIKSAVTFITPLSTSLSFKDLLP